MYLKLRPAICVVFLFVVLSVVPVIADYEVLTGDYDGVHDPVMARQGDSYYVFNTGTRIHIRRSADMHHWEFIGRVFESVPDWVFVEVDNYSGGSLWAPDISYFNGKYHLYYSASTFGSNDSCIGLATNTTLDPDDPAYEWVDSGGPVICSTYSNNYNAIDPALLIDDTGPETTYWLSFGSFWDGIKMFQIDPNTGYPMDNPPVLYSIASRDNHRIEAPFIIIRDGFYYLFVSFDYCCQGASSTYNVRFGWASSPTGSYLDKSGVPMMTGGGTQITWPTAEWKGPGHQAVFKDDDGSWWLIHHAYPDPGDWPSYMRIHRLYWTPNNWPTLEEPTCDDVHNLGYGLESDWYEDCYINFYDLACFANSWLEDDGYPGLDELFDLTEQWLECNNPQDENCTPNW